MDIKAYSLALRKFAIDRDWEQFHNPKNLSVALMVESGELAEIFQWMSEEQSKSVINDLRTQTEVAQEIADIQLYLIRIADILNIDIEDAVKKKLIINAEKYPIELSKGNATKYSKR